MPAFGVYDSLAKAQRELDIVGVLEPFLQPQPHEPEPFLAGLLRFALEIGYNNSEFAISESLIYPVLRDVWAHFTDRLQLWSRPWFESEELRGNPDYVVTRISRLGRQIFDAPFLIVVEAKEERFDAGWGQCLAALVTAQELNGHPDWPVYGVVSCGKEWQFGKLVGKTLVRDPRFSTLNDLPQLCGALRFVFSQAHQQAIAA
jgi:hypothetical protein